MRRVRARGVGLVAVLLATGLTTAPGPASAVVIQCPASADAFVWDGSAGDPAGAVGDGTSWADAYNWDRDCVPGLLVQTSGDGYDDVVTIPAGAGVHLGDGESAHIARLVNNGDADDRDGCAPQRVGYLLEPGDGAEGPARGHRPVHGHLPARLGVHRPGRRDPVHPRLHLAVPGSAAAGGEGTTVVAAGATMNVSGRGVNLQDQRVIENRGTVLARPVPGTSPPTTAPGSATCGRRPPHRCRPS